MITTDNAKSMLNATQKVSDHVELGLGCIDHILQLIINNSIKKVPVIEIAVKRFKKLAKATHNSALNIARIRKACSDLNRSETDKDKHCTFVKIHNPVDTRWNSLLMMFRGVIHLKPALLSIKYDARERVKDSPLKGLVPEEIDFDLIKKLVPLLTVIESASELLSGDKYPTICHVIPKLYMIRSRMHSVMTVGTTLAKFAPVRELVELMHEDLTSRFPLDGAQQNIYAFGNLLHPNYRHLILSDLKMDKITIDNMVKENQVVEPEVAAPTEREILDEAVVGDVDEFEDEDSFFRKLTQQWSQKPTAAASSQASQSLIPQSPLENEIARYVNNAEQGSSELSTDMDVLLWWKDHAKIYPLMSNLAKKYLAVQATSCSSERTFSTGGRTVTNTRTRLATSNVHMIVYVKENMDKVQLKNFKSTTEEEKNAEEEAEEAHSEEEIDIEDLV